MSNDYLNGGKKPQGENAESENEPKQKNYTFFLVAAGGFVAGAILFAISFFIKGAGVHLLFASMISQLICATFLNAQKRKYDFIWIKVLRVACYAVMIAALAIVIWGVSVASK